MHGNVSREPGRSTGSDQQASGWKYTPGLRGSSDVAKPGGDPDAQVQQHHDAPFDVEGGRDELVAHGGLKTLAASPRGGTLGETPCDAVTRCVMSAFLESRAVDSSGLGRQSTAGRPKGWNR